MATEPVDREPVFEPLDAIFTFPAIVVELKDRLAAASEIGHQEAQAGAGGGAFGLIDDTVPNTHTRLYV